MINFKESKKIKELSGSGEFIFIDSIEILRRVNYTCNDVLPHVIKRIWYSTLKITYPSFPHTTIKVEHWKNPTP